MVAELVCNY